MHKRSSLYISVIGKWIFSTIHCGWLCAVFVLGLREKNVHLITKCLCANQSCSTVKRIVTRCKCIDDFRSTVELIARKGIINSAFLSGRLRWSKGNSKQRQQLHARLGCKTGLWYRLTKGVCVLGVISRKGLGVVNL